MAGEFGAEGVEEEGLAGGDGDDPVRSVKAGFWLKKKRGGEEKKWLQGLYVPAKLVGEDGDCCVWCLVSIREHDLEE